MQQGYDARQGLLPMERREVGDMQCKYDRPGLQLAFDVADLQFVDVHGVGPLVCLLVE